MSSNRKYDPEHYNVQRENVRCLLAEYPLLRGRDSASSIRLILKYWERFNDVRLNIPDHIIDKLASPLTIVRRRQEIQQSGEFRGIEITAEIDLKTS